MFEWLPQFGDMLLQVVLPSLATIVGGMIVGLLNKQLKKANLELTEAQQERIKELIRDAIRATEEAARRQAMTSAEKRSKTVEAIARTVPELPTAEISTALDAQLPIVRKDIAVPAPVTIMPAVPLSIDPGQPRASRQ